MAKISSPVRDEAVYFLNTDDDIRPGHTGCESEGISFDSEPSPECPCVSLQACVEKGIGGYRCDSGQKAEASSGGTYTGRGVKGAIPSVRGESSNRQPTLW